MSYMVCHGMKSKAGDIKNIEKQHVPSLLYAMRIADFFHQPVTNIFCYHPGQTQCKGADHNGE